MNDQIGKNGFPPNGSPATSAGDPQLAAYDSLLDLLQTRILLLLRRSIAAVLRELLFAFNRFMVCTFTIRGLAWRLESLRSGRSLADVIRRYNAVHPVQQVLLIHRNTGLLLCDEGTRPGPARDPDMVSGMLTAVRDFVTDSFEGAGAADLHTIEVSGITVYVESAPDAVLAGVMRGPATAEVRTVFRAALKQITDRFAAELKDFRGDTSPLLAARPALRSCLRIESLGLNRRLAPITVVFIAALAVFAAWSLAYNSFWNSRWKSFTAEMRQEHGVVVLRAVGGWGRFTIEGLRDPLSVDPSIRLQYHGLPADRVNMRWTMYHDLGAPFVVARAREMLSPPETVSLRVRDGVLVLSGSAPASWLARFKQPLPEISGVSVVDISAVTMNDTDIEARWQAFVQALASEPGIMVVKADRGEHGFSVSGLRDPLAEDPARILREMGPPPSDVKADWRPFLSLDPGLVLLRAKLALEPPSSVRLSLDGATLSADGIAPHSWVKRTMATARTIPGVSVFDADALRDADAMRMLALANEIRALRFDFMAGAPSLWPGQKERVDELISKIASLSDVARVVETRVSIEVIGHTNPTGDPAQEQTDSEDLCRRLLDMLPLDKIGRPLFTIRGEGAKQADIPDTERRPGHNRIVTLNVVSTSR